MAVVTLTLTGWGLSADSVTVKARFVVPGPLPSAMDALAIETLGPSSSVIVPVAVALPFTVEFVTFVIVTVKVSLSSSSESRLIVIEIWPEVAELIPEEPEGTANLPAVPVKDVNKLLRRAGVELPVTGTVTGSRIRLDGLRAGSADRYTVDATLESETTMTARFEASGGPVNLTLTRQ